VLQVLGWTQKGVREENHPYLTITGQTALCPGITMIRGGLGITTHDVVIQHIKVRPGESGVIQLIQRENTPKVLLFMTMPRKS